MVRSSPAGASRARIACIPSQRHPSTHGREHAVIRSSHIENLIRPGALNERADWCISRIRKLQRDTPIHTLVCRGSSGLIPTSIAAYVLGIPIGYVRKQAESPNTTLMFEGPHFLQNYVVIDDFISSGQTMQAIADAVRAHDLTAKFIAALLHSREDVDRTLCHFK